MKSVIRYFVENPVVTNIITFFLLIFGLYTMLTMTREFFPPADVDRVLIRIPYPGATPEEVEKGVVTKVENAIEGVKYIDEVTSLAYENQGLVVVKVQSGADLQRVADEIRNEIDVIQDFPLEAEDPTVEVIEQQVPAIAVIVYGNAPERLLKRVADGIKDDLIRAPMISRAVLSGTRAEEISIELDPEKLTAYGLTFEEVGRAVRSNNVDLAGGEIKSATGNILVRTLTEEQSGLDLERIIVRSDIDGRFIRLSDVATIKDGFQETIIRGSFQGKNAAQVVVFKRGNEDAVAIAEYVKNYIAEKALEFPGDDINIGYRTDLARIIAERIALLAKNALQGIFLVLLSLAFFLNIRMAFWVASGLVIAFAGTFIVMSWLGGTINLISLFGLILVVGLLVDDAIVVAENVFYHYEHGENIHDAAISGTLEVAGPVTATVMTTIVAFAPLAFLDSVVGDIMAAIPIVVIASLGVSLFECLTILPSHLNDFALPKKREKRNGTKPKTIFGKVASIRDYILDRLLPRGYEKLLRLALTWRYVSLAAILFISMFTVALVVAGWLPFVLFQKVDGDTIIAEVEMAAGTKAEVTEETLRRIAAAIQDQPEVRNVWSVVGFQEEANPPFFADPAIIGEVVVEIVGAEERDRTGQELLNAWRADVGQIPGAVNVKFRERSGGPPGAEIELRVRGPNNEVVEEAVRYIRSRLESYTGVKDIEDDGGTGKLEVRATLRESARSLGISAEDLARTLRGAYFGYEAQVLQRGNEEVKIWVRLSEESRRSVSELLRLRVITPSGDLVPISEVANLQLVRGVSGIARVDGMRATTIKADVDFALANTAQVTAALEEDLKDLSSSFPGVTVSYEGAKKETSESIAGLAVGFPIALIMIYCILAILFSSYLQPLIVMVAIPYAIVGAALGHLLYGLIPGREFMPITFLSLIGMVGLAGIAVNDSLVLVKFINDARKNPDLSLFEAIVTSGLRRLRPIILTSLTTIVGLAPIMLETSFQAQFLIPMAISIAFGLALATVLTLLLLPCLYLVLEDFKNLARIAVGGTWHDVTDKDEELVQTP